MNMNHFLIEISGLSPVFHEKLEALNSGCSSVPSSPSNCSNCSGSSLDNFGDDWSISREDAIKMGQSILDGGPVLNPYISVKVENDIFDTCGCENDKNDSMEADTFSDLLDSPVNSCIQLQDYFDPGLIQFNDIKTITPSVNEDSLPLKGYKDTDKNISKTQDGSAKLAAKGQTRKRSTNDSDHSYGNINVKQKRTENILVKKEKNSSNSKSEKDDKYWERRNKNNLAAKRSREIKRTKEMELVKKSSSLEKENADLLKQIKKLKKIIHKLELKIERS
jgi:hypothetical protein